MRRRWAQEEAGEYDGDDDAGECVWGGGVKGWGKFGQLVVSAGFH